MTNAHKARMKKVRLLLWVLVALAVAGTAALLLVRRGPAGPPEAQTASAGVSLGGAFTLTGADGKLFSSARLSGKPYAIFFGFTRCGNVCPMTLSRLARLRSEAADEDRLNIVFVTIDPANDGPKEVGQYAALFNTPIIGLTGSPADIERVKKQYGIFAQPTPHAAAGQEMQHTSAVLLFDSDGRFVSTIAPDEADSSALAKLKRVTT